MSGKNEAKKGAFSLERDLKRNISYQTMYQLLSVIAPLVVTPYISRLLGSENIGTYSYTYSIAYYFVMFAILGVTNYGNRTIASVNKSREERSRVFWEIYVFQMIMSILMLGLYIVYLLLFCKKNHFIAILQILYVLTPLFDISWLFFGCEDVKPVVIKNTIVKIISLVGIFTLVRSEKDLWIYTILLSGGQLFGMISMWFSLSKVIDFYKPCLTNIKKHIVPNITLFIPVIAISVYKTMDKIMIGALSSNAQVGFYTNAESLINAPMGFILAVGTVMLPRITNMLANGKQDESIELFHKSMKLTMCFVCAASFGISTVAASFVPIYYGAGYQDCIFLLRGQAIVMLFLAWANVVRTQYLLPHKHDKKYILSIFSGAGINVVLNLILIPKYQAAGAMVATIAAEGIVCIVQTLDAVHHINIFKCFMENIFFIISGIVMMVLTKTIVKTNASVKSLFLQIFVGGAIYVSLLAIYIFCQRNIQKTIHSNDGGK